MSEPVRSRDPFDVFSRMMGGTEREPLAGSQEWLPAVDIREEQEGYLLVMDVPGLAAEDLDVDLHEGILTVRGARSEEETKQGEHYIRVERRQGKFARQFRVPPSTRPEDLHAGVKDGVLTIHVPKGGAPESRRVPVR
jgi:HSP20 family protein